MRHPRPPKTVETFCETHDQAGACTQECVDLTNAMSEGYGYSEYIYDPGRVHEPPPRPETSYFLDTERRRVAERIIHPDMCHCTECRDLGRQPIPCPECQGQGDRDCPVCGGEREIMAVVIN